jgi:hypothetical protein
MSRNINVNPDHYKTAGRERQGEDVVQELEKQEYSVAHESRARRGPKLATRVQDGASVARPRRRAGKARKK